MILARLPFRAFPNEYDIFKIAVPSFPSKSDTGAADAAVFATAAATSGLRSMFLHTVI